jgi:small subunit ribosomal protein S18
MSDQEQTNRSSDSSGARTGRQSGGFRGRRGGGRRRRACPFCVDNVKRVDYKDGDLLRRFVNEEGKIRPRRQTNVCAKHQRSLATAVKRARHLALLPFTGQHEQEMQKG